MDPVEKRRRCREYALRFIDIQRDEFRRLGIFGDWENPYLTMTPAYEAVIARELGRFVGRGLVYKGLKPVHWCMYCKTALAQAEVEYEDQRTPSIYVKFPLVHALPDSPEAPRPRVVIWTTTPWTLPANLAVAVHPEEEYVALEVAEAPGGRARDPRGGRRLADAFTGGGATSATRGASRRSPVGSSTGSPYRHPWIARTGRIAAADFVSMDTGTGLVHIAPGHGEEDYELGRRLGLKTYNPVDDDGRFTPEVERSRGLTVWEANPDHRGPAAASAGCWLPRCRSITPTRTAGAARTPRSSAPPSSGSSRSTGAACASGRCEAIRARWRGSPPGARSASTTWSPIGRSG